MEKDVISEADDTIVIDVPEQKEYVISIANNRYKIKPIFSIYVGSITNFVGFPIPLVALSAHIE